MLAPVSIPVRWPSSPHRFRLDREVRLGYNLARVMSKKLTRQIILGAVGLFWLWEAWETYAQVGWVLKSDLLAGMTILFFVLAITAKGG